MNKCRFTRRYALALVTAALTLLVAGCRAAEPSVGEAMKRFFDTGERAALDKAAELLRTETGENRHGEYGLFLDRLIPYLRAREGGGAARRLDPLQDAVMRELTANDNELARRLLELAYLGSEESGGLEGRDAFARELVACTPPDRRQGEDPARIISIMGLGPGDKVADVGSGPGFFTFVFAKHVGPAGRVYAVEVNGPMIDFLGRFIAAQKITNVEVVTGEKNDCSLPDGVMDHAYMTHMFVDIDVHYGLSHRKKLFGSVLRGLRPGGLFTVCEPDRPNQPDLTAAQIGERLALYGFEVVKTLPSESPVTPHGVKCAQGRRPLVAK